MEVIAQSITPEQTGWSYESVFSILALIISSIGLFLEVINNNKNNKLSVEADIIKEVYHDYLINIIPNSRKKIVYSQNKVTGTKNFMEALNEMRKASLFYKYQDEKFYGTLTNLIQELEDHVANNNKKMSKVEYQGYDNKISEDIGKIYKEIVNRQTGRNRYVEKIKIFFTRKNLNIFYLVVNFIVCYSIFIYILPRSPWNISRLLARLISLN